MGTLGSAILTAVLTIAIAAWIGYLVGALAVYLVKLRR